VRQPLPAVAAVVSFIEAINRSDVAHLASLMTEDHRLQVFDESPLDGKEANIEGWRGYTSAFPDYVIYPHQLVARNAEVIVLGHTTGSHLDLPDEQESELTLLWRATVRDGRLQLWQLIKDTPDRRVEFGIGRDA
jgi:ketosteroid isomerase-like protein